MRTPDEALAVVKHQASNGPAFAVGMCKKQTRLAYGVPSDGSDDATEAWRNTDHRLAGPADAAPKGALVWWTGGSDGHGHVAIADGAGYVWSVDIKRAGYWDRVPVGEISRSWPRLQLAGITADIDGVRVVPAPVKRSRVQLAVTTWRTERQVDLALLDAAVAAGRTGAVKTARDRIDAAMRDLARQVPR